MAFSINVQKNNLELLNYTHGNNIYIKKGFLSNYANYRAQNHWHVEVEFIIILHGEMEYCINGTTLTLKENDGIFVNSRQMHYGFSSRNMECEFLCFVINPSILSYEELIYDNLIKPIMLNQNLPFLHLNNLVTWHRDINQLLCHMYAIKDTNTSLLQIPSDFAKIWSILFDNLSSFTYQNEYLDSGINDVKKMILFIHDNYEKKINITDIAHSGNMEISKCCKLFNKYAKCSPNAFLIYFRLSKSISYLINTQKNITEIAFMVGFNSSSFYAETFKKYYGISPLNYRKRNACF